MTSTSKTKVMFKIMQFQKLITLTVDTDKLERAQHGNSSTAQHELCQAIKVACRRANYPEIVDLQWNEVQIIGKETVLSLGRGCTCNCEYCDIGHHCSSLRQGCNRGLGSNR